MKGGAASEASQGAERRVRILLLGFSVRRFDHARQYPVHPHLQLIASLLAHSHHPFYCISLARRSAQEEEYIFAIGEEIDTPFGSGKVIDIRIVEEEEQVRGERVRAYNVRTRRFAPRSLRSAGTKLF